ncbi:MAG: HAMP domain-containing histidine kinase [Clostridia bacterium]|nr:HAMP domain-containing histidine kinase [Clostridia bacterium]
MTLKELNEKIAEEYKNPKRRFRRTFVLATAGVIVVAFFAVILAEWILLKAGAVSSETLERSWFLTALIIGSASLLIGTFLSWLTGKFVFRPLNKLLDGMGKLAAGAYDTRLDFGDAEALKPISDGFNALAGELQKTEILRADFVNDFSHEFKTPISSISGLVALMKKGELSREKQLEYLCVIEEETNRLSGMTTNILNLSKIESQGILTEETRFNLSEQIRTCILLLEKKWLKKQLRLDLEFPECEIVGNEDMLKQVWLNLLDNAVKFSDERGELSVRIEEEEKAVVVRIGNTGPTIPEEEKEHIFRKFYRADKARSREGNGIGLSIVKHIVELHGGSVFVESTDGHTVFSVNLPK